MSTPPVLALHRRLARVPLVGPRLFDLAFSQKAPYFTTVRPRFTVVEPDHVELVVRHRRRVSNHLGTMHVIAICNGLEAAMGCLAEVSIPPGKRWIPRGMEVRYPARAEGDIICVATTEPAAWTAEDPDLPVTVRAVRGDGTVVVEGTIRLWVTPRRPRSSTT